MKNLVLVTMLALASFCWGQSSATGCLVVRNDKKHERVMSAGNVPFALRYSNKTLKQLGNEGVNVIVIDRHERANPDACSAAPVHIEHAFKLEPMRDEAAKLKQPESVRQEPLCIEFVTYRDGTQSCLRWSSK